MRRTLVQFGPYALDVREHTLSRSGVRVPIAPKTLKLLEHLALHAGRLVSKEDLLRTVWADVHVESAVLKTTIADQRRLLGDDAQSPRYVETVDRYGYRFLHGAPISPPAALTPVLIGRAREIADVRQLLATGRMLTLTGAPGVGKSALARSAAAEAAASGAGTVFWVDVASASDAPALQRLISDVTVHALRPAGRGSIVRSPGSHRVLLVLDNCEHLAVTCARVAEALRSCPGVALLATSTVRLNLEGEAVYVVQPLSLPAPSAESQTALRAGSVRLFLQRAAESSASQIRDEDIPAVVAICRSLDGLPLAIELAARRLKLLSLRQLAERLTNLPILLSDPSIGLGRHGSLASLLGPACTSLAADTKRVLGLLAECTGSLTLDEVERVCAEGGLSTPSALDSLSQLLDHSWLAVEPAEPGSEKRFRLFEPMRQYVRATRSEWTAPPSVGASSNASGT